MKLQTEMILCLDNTKLPLRHTWVQCRLNGEVGQAITSQMCFFSVLFELAMEKVKVQKKFDN
jgi:hypothetical protein